MWPARKPRLNKPERPCKVAQANTHVHSHAHPQCSHVMAYVQTSCPKQRSPTEEGSTPALYCARPYVGILLTEASKNKALVTGNFRCGAGDVGKHSTPQTGVNQEIAVKLEAAPWPVTDSHGQSNLCSRVIRRKPTASESLKEALVHTWLPVARKCD